MITMEPLMRRRPAFGWQSLTDGERGVAHLVAQGLTNRDVASRLYVSPHTIDFHLRQIYRKLDIASRVDLTRIVTERTTKEEVWAAVRRTTTATSSVST